MHEIEDAYADKIARRETKTAYHERVSGATGYAQQRVIVLKEEIAKISSKDEHATRSAP